MLGAGDTVEIEDPGFTFGDDGEIIQFSPRRELARTPAKIAGATMSADVGANVRAQKEHEERRQVANQVSFAAFFHIILHCDISCWSCGLTSLPSLEAQDTATHDLTAGFRTHSGGYLQCPRPAMFARCLFPWFCLILQCF
jgi:hypothetical protein